MSVDLINGLFEFFGAIAVSSSIRQIIKDKGYAGVSPLNILFFQSWGLFNLYYYPHINQPFSFFGSIALATANAVYLFCLFKFPHLKREDTDIDYENERW